MNQLSQIIFCFSPNRGSEAPLKLLYLSAEKMGLKPVLLMKIENYI